MFKRKAPIIIALGLVAVFAVGIAFLRAEPRDTDLTTPATKAMRDRYERLGHKLGADDMLVEILSRTETEGFVRVAVAPVQTIHLLRLTNDGGWKVAGDLNESFDRFLQDKKIFDDLMTRLMATAKERGVRNPSDPRPRFKVDWLDQQPQAFLEVEFMDKTTPCIYTERYFLKKSEWVREGDGLFRVMAPPPRRK